MAEKDQSQPREKPIHELLTHSLATIYTGSGDNPTRWTVHERLLCERSKFFASICYGKGSSKGDKTFGLPDEDDEPFRLFVGWLYSSQIPIPEQETELTVLFDLYLMGEKWSIAALAKDVLNSIRRFYRLNNTYPSLRRVQYIYANTTSDSPMRDFLVGSIAHMLVTGKSGFPSHWEKALQKNGQLAVDLIKAMQDWHVAGEDIPDPREAPLEAEREGIRGIEKMEQNQQGKEKELTNGTKVGERKLEDVLDNDDSEATLHEQV